MSDKAPAAPAGWYPDPNGGQRYWNGENWLDIPEPEISTAAIQNTSVEAPHAKPLSSKSKLFIGIAAVVVALVVIIAFSVQASNQAAYEAEQVSIAQEKKASADAQAAEEARILQDRTKQVDEIVESVKGAAQKVIDSGYISGSILEAYCNPVAGGSLGDIKETTTAFECFVATEENSDGTRKGYFWDVTKNWDTGRYNWTFRDN